MEFKNNHDFITLFEKRLSEFTGAPYVVTTNSATSAIFLSIKMSQKFGLIDTDVVLIPGHTYISVPQVLKQLGYHVYFEYMMWEEKYRIKDTNIWDCAVGFKPDMYESGTIQCLSFHQKKCINIGQGGAILLDNEEQYKYLKRIGWDGRDSSVPLSYELDIHTDNVIVDSYHMYLSPDNCAKGVLILNQITKQDVSMKLGKYSDYPDVSVLEWR